MEINPTAANDIRAYSVDIVNARGEYQINTLVYATDRIDARNKLAERTTGTRLLPGELVGKAREL